MNRSTAPFLDAPHDERAGHASNYTESDLRAFDALNLFSSDKIKSTTGSSKSTLNNSTIDYTETDLAEFEKLNLAAKQNGSGTSYSLAAEDTEYKIGFLVQPIMSVFIQPMILCCLKRYMRLMIRRK